MNFQPNKDEKPLRDLPLSAYQFALPPELIAQYPAGKRKESRLCVVESDSVQHEIFYQIENRIHSGDLLVFNDTKVIPARIFASKESGGKVEIFVERLSSQTQFQAQIRSSKSPRADQILMIDRQPLVKILDRLENGFYQCEVLQHENVMSFLQEYGQIPLPPYLGRDVEALDAERYQTVYAKHSGSVAAPTAGFHFDENLLENLRDKGVHFGYVTLHIGAGTFQPVRVERISEHRMHAEWMSVSPELCQQIEAAHARGGRVIAVGTTALRALETASFHGKIAPFSGDTQIFIYPGFQFRCVDVLITNFHLPGSTLMMLVCALGGYHRVMNAYQKVIQERYRFFSYGDAMWLPKLEHDLKSHST